MHFDTSQTESLRNSRLKICATVGKSNAEFYSAVSQVCNLQRVEIRFVANDFQHPAEYNSAKQQIKNLRYEWEPPRGAMRIGVRGFCPAFVYCCQRDEVSRWSYRNPRRAKAPSPLRSAGALHTGMQSRAKAPVKNRLPLVSVLFIH